MINVLKPIAVSFAGGILIACMLAMSAPVSAKGSGGSAKSSGSSSASHKPGRPAPPVFLEGSAAGRALGSCSVSRKPVTNASGTVVSYRRVQVCN
jgi:hypothetical protein